MKVKTSRSLVRGFGPDPDGSLSRLADFLKSCERACVKDTPWKPARYQGRGALGGDERYWPGADELAACQLPDVQLPDWRRVTGPPDHHAGRHCSAVQSAGDGEKPTLHRAGICIAIAPAVFGAVELCACYSAARAGIPTSFTHPPQFFPPLVTAVLLLRIGGVSSRPSGPPTRAITYGE